MTARPAVDPAEGTAGAVSGLRTASADIAVRVNPLQSGGTDDLAAAIEAGADLIVVPQATVASTRQAADLAGARPIIPLIETPRGVIDALAIAEAAALKSRALGAGGCFAIHPSQVEVLNRVFMPSDQALREAREIIALAEKMSLSGGAIALHDQKMIDAPIVARARVVLAVGRRFKGASSSPP